ncbi:hypothetical protein CRM79_17255 [Pantoea agglomerans]|nr:hypothetical protein CRM79_17255 [Pantoea agglomerans]
MRLYSCWRLLTNSTLSASGSNTLAQHEGNMGASRAGDKNAGSVFEQRKALARQRAHLMDEVRTRAGRATRDWLKRLSSLSIFPERAQSESKSGQTLSPSSNLCSATAIFCF